MSHFLNMAGYALYVWPAYALVLLIFAINAWQAVKKLRRVLKQCHQLPNELENEKTPATN